MSGAGAERRLEAETDRISGEYARRAREIPKDRYCWSNPGNLLSHAETARAVIRALSSKGLYPLEGLRILDVGCGAGQWLLEFLQWHAIASDIAGIDLLPERVVAAKQRLLGADIRVGNAGALPWPDASFDVVTQFVMLSSVLDREVQARIASEMIRVTRPGGIIVSVDFTWNNPFNPGVRGVTNSRLRDLFPGCSIQTQSLLLPPPAARIIGRHSWSALMLLELLPFMRTHVAAAISPTRA